jgi:hypothetical protein
MPHIDHELRQAIEHHDVHSCEAEHDELNEAREGGWREHHPWWDEHKHGRHTQQDWDDPEHDRDEIATNLAVTWADRCLMSDEVFPAISEGRCLPPLSLGVGVEQNCNHAGGGHAALQRAGEGN